MEERHESEPEECPYTYLRSISPHQNSNMRARAHLRRYHPFSAFCHELELPVFSVKDIQGIIELHCGCLGVIGAPGRITFGSAETSAMAETCNACMQTTCVLKPDWCRNEAFLS